MTYGFVAKGDNGALLASSESANYELAQRVVAATQSGNVYTYYFTPTRFPVFFIEIPLGGKAGILDSTESSVRIIADGLYPLRVYRRITQASGYGIAVYDTSNKLTFRAGAGILNVQNAGQMVIGSAFTGRGEAVSFPSLASRTLTSASTAAVEGDAIVWQTYEMVYVCQTNYVFTIVGQSCTDYGTFVICFPEYGMVPVTTCSYEFITNTWMTIPVHTVRTTNWAVQRAVANKASTNTYVQDWVTHTSGYYKEILTTEFVSINIGTSYNAPAGYIPPPQFAGSPFWGFAGIYSSNNTFPYSNGQTKQIAATILTG